MTSLTEILENRIDEMRSRVAAHRDLHDAPLPSLRANSAALETIPRSGGKLTYHAGSGEMIVGAGTAYMGRGRKRWAVAN
jgi:hypothetical protein